MKTLPIVSAALVMFSSCVWACEGECIVGITDAYAGAYATPVQNALKKTDRYLVQIASRPTRRNTQNETPAFAGALRSLLGLGGSESSPPSKHPSGLKPPQPPSFAAVPPPPSYTYLSHLHTTLTNRLHDALRISIFPSYFHGKCLYPGTNEVPAGCPNPDCPVVCGTPGSMVHFFSTLRFIAYNATRNLMDELTGPESDEYQGVERAVVANAGDSKPGIKVQVAKGMKQAGEWLEEECGGFAIDAEGALPHCSWEEEMKAFILSYP